MKEAEQLDQDANENEEAERLAKEEEEARKARLKKKLKD